VERRTSHAAMIIAQHSTFHVPRSKWYPRWASISFDPPYIDSPRKMRNSE
jgi:hypothetical protein